MDYKNNNFLATGFHWFIGVVEDIYDPYEQGRVRVRCFGYHTSSKDKDDGIRTLDLPWANVMTPITSGSCSGIGESATGVVQGSWVVGFFRDGEACQDPLVLGTLPSKTPGPDNYENGFADPFGENPRDYNANDQPKGSTSEYRESSSYINKTALRNDTRFVDADGKKLDVPTAVPPTTDTLKNTLQKDKKFFERKRWIQDSQEDVTNPTYPNCHTTEYACGHTVEFDETPNNERILVQHSTGTYSEIDAQGNKTIVVNGDEYKVVIGGNNVTVKGNCNLTITGDARTMVKGDYYMEVEKDYHLLVHGNKHEKIVMSDFLEVDKNQMLNVTGNLISSIGEYEKRTIQATHQSPAANDSPKAFEFECKRSGDITFGANLSTVVMGNESRSVIGTLFQNTGARTDVIDTTYKIDVTSTLDIDATGKITVDTPDAMDLHAAGVTDIDGSRINLN